MRANATQALASETLLCAGEVSIRERDVGVKLVHDSQLKTVKDYAPEDASLLCSIGRIVCAWTMLEQSVEAKIVSMREAMGDIHSVGSRTRPTMKKLMTEIRTIVSMRDRRNVAALSEISEMEREVQRIDHFRSLVIHGFMHPDGDGFSCRDSRNRVLHVETDQLDKEIISLEVLASRLLSI